MSMKIALLFLMAAVVAIQAAPKEKDPKGGVSVDVNRQNRDGTRVRVDAKHEVFNANDGRTRGEVYGHAERTFGGKYDGERSHGGGFRFEHTWK